MPQAAAGDDQRQPRRRTAGDRQRRGAARLQGIADAWLLHDRDIVARCDDSVLRPAAGGAPQFIRRARGYTPRAIRLPRSGPSVLATGAWLKNTVCITRGDEAFLSPHIGDLDNAATCHALAEMVQHLCGVLDVQPQAVAHDLHPDFFSTRFAQLGRSTHGTARRGRAAPPRARRRGGGRTRIHGAAAGSGARRRGPGHDGAAWGGELLRVQGAECRAPRPSGNDRHAGRRRAAREPWRLAAAVLHACGPAVRSPALRRPGCRRRRGADAARGLRCPPTTSLGRWFDAAAALLDVRQVKRLRRPGGDAARSPGRHRRPRWPLRSTWRRVCTVDAAVGARRAGPAAPAGPPGRRDRRRARRRPVPWCAGPRPGALGGPGCGADRCAHRGPGRRLLSQRTCSPRCCVPCWPNRACRPAGPPGTPNDGGISLGQAWVALCTMPTGD
jgi:hydrogenase maturation protein HypF